jgi:hypothetical protein
MITTGRQAAGAALLAVLLCSCGAAASDAYVIQNDPGHVEAIPGSDLGLVTLADGAAERLQLRTTEVVAAGKHLVVPSEAVFVDTSGAWWVFTNPEPDHFVRAEIQLVRQQDGKAILAAGPPPGTKVVVLGVAELYGIEQSIGH